ncbi:MAG: cytidylyltransferase domain-containing protein [Bacillota bacterium]
MKDKEFLALILARGGSKGIPGKNIKKLNGKPLIAYTIEAAKKSKHVDRIVVSTDDEKIAGVAEEYGAEVPFLRPDELATDEVSGNDAILHALNFLKEEQGYTADYIMNLQPTSPFRNSMHIDRAINKFLKNKNDYDSLVSVCKAFENPFWMQKIENKQLKPLMDEFSTFSRRQELPEVYQLNGAIYLSSYKSFLESESFYTDNILPYIMDKEQSIDIDDDLDWKLAEILLEENKDEFN